MQSIAILELYLFRDGKYSILFEKKPAVGIWKSILEINTFP